jgi:hypothetical protein
MLRAMLGVLVLVACAAQAEVRQAPGHENLSSATSRRTLRTPPESVKD